MPLFDQKSPQEVQAEIRRQGMLEDASRGTGWAAISRAAASGGRQLAQGLGGEDPRVSKAKALQQIQQDMMNEGWESKAGTAEFYLDAARRVQTVDPAMAMRMAEEGKKLQMAQEDRTLTRENLQSQIDARKAKKTAATMGDAKDYGLDPDRYKVILQPTGTAKIVDTKSGSSVTTQINSETGYVHRFENGKDLGALQVKGKPMISQAWAKENRITDNQKVLKDQRDFRNKIREKSLKLRSEKFVFEKTGKFYDQYKNSVKTVTDMDSGIQRVISILEKDAFTPGDTPILKRALASISKTNTKAQSEIEAWEAGEVGDLIGRMSSSISKWATGVPSKEERRLQLEAAKSLRHEFVDPTFEKYQNYFSLKAARFDVNPDDVVTPRLSEAEDAQVSSQADFDKLKSGDWYMNTKTGKRAQKQ